MGALAARVSELKCIDRFHPLQTRNFEVSAAAHEDTNERLPESLSQTGVLDG